MSSEFTGKDLNDKIELLKQIALDAGDAFGMEKQFMPLDYRKAFTPAVTLQMVSIIQTAAEIPVNPAAIADEIDKLGRLLK